jgi:hypothetical protein
MKILIAVSHDVIFKPTYVYRLLLRLHEYDIVGVFEVKGKGGNISKKNNLSTLNFCGMKGVFFLSSIIFFRKIISALPFPIFIRSRSTVKRVCASFDVPYNNIDNINKKSTIKNIENLSPDLIISFQHQIFCAELLTLKGVKFINCHPALLPKYRGVKPIFWSMLNDDDEFGITVHEMTIDIDCGNILSQSKIKFISHWSLFQNYIAAYDLAVDTTIKAVDVIAGKNTCVVIDSSSVNEKYFRAPEKKDKDEFIKLSKSVI